jgi:hypothetical protein
MAFNYKVIWKEDSDTPCVIHEKTQKTIDKENITNKFKIDPIKEFINEKNRKYFGHICFNCKNKKHCDKWCNKIILKCEDYGR